MKTRKYSTVVLLLFFSFTALPDATRAQSANLAFVRGTATSVGNIQFSSILDSVNITGGLTAPGRISGDLSIPANRIQYDVINGNQGTMSSWTVYYSSSVGPKIIGAGTPLGYVTSSGKIVSQGGVAYGTLFNAGYGIYHYNTGSPWSIDYEADHITFNGMAGPQAGLGMNDGAGVVEPTPYLPSFDIAFSTNLSCGLVTASAMINASNLTGQVYGPVPNTGLPSAAPGAIGGVGLQIEKTNGILLVTHVIVAGPAERAGLQVDSKIISIDGMPVSDMTVNDAVKLLRGGIGTAVKLKVLLPDGTPRDMSLTRADIGALMQHGGGLQPSLIINFTNLVPGTILTNGSPIAPGISFGGPDTAESFLYEAVVVDLGNGARGLRQVSLHQYEFLRPSYIDFQFNLPQPVESAGVTAEPVVSGKGSPGITAYDSSGKTLFSWGAFFHDPPEFFGIYGKAHPSISYLEFANSEYPSPAIYQVDNLKVQYVPQPGVNVPQPQNR